MRKEGCREQRRGQPARGRAQGRRASSEERMKNMRVQSHRGQMAGKQETLAGMWRTRGGTARADVMCQRGELSLMNQKARFQAHTCKQLCERVKFVCACGSDFFFFLTLYFFSTRWCKKWRILLCVFCLYETEFFLSHTDRKKKDKWILQKRKNTKYAFVWANTSKCLEF